MTMRDVVADAGKVISMIRRCCARSLLQDATHTDRRYACFLKYIFSFDKLRIHPMSWTFDEMRGYMDAYKNYLRKVDDE